MKKNNPIVFCTNPKHGHLDFYLDVSGNVFYLFTTKYYSNPIYNEYKNGMRLENAYKATCHFRQQQLKEKILRISKYILEEYAIPHEKPRKKEITRHTLRYAEFEVA